MSDEYIPVPGRSPFKDWGHLLQGIHRKGLIKDLKRLRKAKKLIMSMGSSFTACYDNGNIELTEFIDSAISRFEEDLNMVNKIMRG